MQMTRSEALSLLPRGFPNRGLGNLLGIASLALTHLASGDPPDAVSPLTSYVFGEDTNQLATPTVFASPLVAYHFLESVGDANLTYTASPVVSFNFPGAPVIGLHPATRRISEGAGVTFSAAASGSEPLAYRWLKNGVSIPGAVGPTLAIPNVVRSDDALYSVAVANGFGSARSRAARLFVNPAGMPPVTINPPVEGTGQNPTGPVASPLVVFSDLVIYKQDGSYGSSRDLDGSRMTVVLTHGWKSAPYVWCDAMAKELLDASHSISGGRDINVVAWNWSGDAASVTPVVPRIMTEGQGAALGKKLLEVLGPTYRQPIHFIGHSFGTLVNCAAANYVHGDSRPGGNPYPWSFDYVRTHMTLLDEAEGLSVGNVFAVLLEVTSSGPVEILTDFVGDGLMERSSRFVIPKNFARIDNYISAVGFSHTQAANVILWRHYDHPIAVGHGYAIDWYRNTIRNPLASAMGYQWSWERHSLIYMPEKGSMWVQSKDAARPEAEVILDPSLAGSDEPFFLTPYIELAEDSIRAQIVGFVTDRFQALGNFVAEQYQHAAGALRSTVRVISRTGTTLNGLGTKTFSSPLQPTFFGGGGSSGGAGAGGSFLPRPLGSAPQVDGAYFEADVPPDATSLLLEYRFTGTAGEGWMSLGANDQLLLKIDARLETFETWHRARPIEIGAFAGQRVRFFFGVFQQGTAEFAVSFRALKFLTTARPRLLAAPDSTGADLSWIAGDNNWKPESSLDLLTWAALPGAVSDDDYRFTIRAAGTSPHEFFRLRKVPPK